MSKNVWSKEDMAHFCDQMDERVPEFGELSISQCTLLAEYSEVAVIQPLYILSGK